MHPIYLFDDGQPLSPQTDLRPAFDIRSGALTNLERTELGWGRPVAGLFVPAALEAITRELHTGIAVNRPMDPDAEAILLNGRWVDCTCSDTLCDLDPRTAITGEDSTLLAACGPARDFQRLTTDAAEGYSTAAHDGVVRLLSRPWHVRSFRDHAISCDLQLLVSRCEGLIASADGGQGGEGGAPIVIDPSAKVSPAAILDSSGGPVVVGAHAVVRPGAIIIGPAYIGPHSTVLERATIRPHTAIGPWCKVNGEISGTIFQGYTNKAHDGFLGDSWVGQWVNLGAGTTNSNLLNTYSEIRACAVPGGPLEPTGEQFLGAIIGDHVTTAICTRLMTGVVIHTGAMISQCAAVTGCTSPFSWMTDDGVRLYRQDRFIETMRAMMARRGVEPTPIYFERIAALYEHARERRPATAIT
jgi:UDP-N-acetylglucosamine diphosphorylase / glucose-1-phosphate thymidylyltransferase / UDP-N-acetylgalactosamine diphosphorylase / glucosamine-1-phosphate N-acetyltransferase / galactosamine-1-phosphate N-acetyltransferase